MEPKSKPSRTSDRRTLDQLLDRVLDQREAAEERRVAKIVRQRSRDSGQISGSAALGTGALVVRRSARRERRGLAKRHPSLPISVSN
jgi:hypothetical protein